MRKKVTAKRPLTKRILELLPHEPFEKKEKPFTTDDLQGLMPDIEIDPLRQTLCKLKAQGRVLWTGGDIKAGTGYAKKKHEKAGYYLPPKVRKPGAPKAKPRLCKYCEQEITGWSHKRTREPSLCRGCNRLLLGIAYARNRFKQGGAIALQMEILIRQTMLELPGDFRQAMQVRTIVAALKSADIDINTIPRWGGDRYNAGRVERIRATLNRTYRNNTTKQKMADDEPLYCMYCKGEIKEWIWRWEQRWPNKCERCQRIVSLVVYARNRLKRDGPLGLGLEIITRRIVMDGPDKTIHEHFLEALEELKLRCIDINQTTIHHHTDKIPNGEGEKDRSRRNEFG